MSPRYAPTLTICFLPVALLPRRYHDPRTRSAFGGLNAKTKLRARHKGRALRGLLVQLPMPRRSVTWTILSGAMLGLHPPYIGCKTNRAPGVRPMSSDSCFALRHPCSYPGTMRINGADRPKDQSRSGQPQMIAPCLSGCHPYPLHLGCYHFPE